mgnify:CR=1 FL=1
MSTTQISELFHDIKFAAEQGELGAASELACKLVDTLDNHNLDFHFTDEEEQYLDWIHGYNILSRPYTRSEVDPDLWELMQEIKENGPPEDTSRLKSLMSSCFYNQGKYPLGMKTINGKKRAVYWYFQNMPWTTSLKMTIRDEIDKAELWSCVVSHREMASVMQPYVNPYHWWINESEFEVTSRVMGYEAWKEWRKVNKV